MLCLGFETWDTVGIYGTTKICSIAFSSLDFENCTLWKGYFVDEVGNVADVIQCRLLLFDIKILQNFIKHQALTLCTIQ